MEPAAKQLELAFETRSKPRELARVDRRLMSVDDLYRLADQQLLSLLLEDERFERKRAQIQPNQLGEWICMWANETPNGGLIGIGIENDGRFTGCDWLDQNQLNRLLQAGHTYVPQARLVHKYVEITNDRGQRDFVLLMRIYAREDRLVETVDRKAFVRHGDQKHALTDEEKLEIRNLRNQQDIERDPSNLTFPDDFDTALVESFVTAVKKKHSVSTSQSDEQILAAKNLGRIEDGEFTPNLACTLVFAKRPQDIVPGCKIRFLRFDGTFQKTGKKSNLVKDEWFEGNMPTIIAQAANHINAATRDFTRLGRDGKFYTAPEYPPDAWYEAVINACVHRSYVYRNMFIFVRMFDDRLEIESPGGFPSGVTAANIYDVTSPRNPFLMQAMFLLEYVKMINEGTKRMRELMHDMALPPPEFVQQPVGSAKVLVTLKNDHMNRREFLDADVSRLLGEAIGETLNADEKRVVNFIAEYGHINVSQCLRLLQNNWPASRKLLGRLVESGILEHMHQEGKERDTRAFFRLKSGNGGGLA